MLFFPFFPQCFLECVCSCCPVYACVNLRNLTLFTLSDLIGVHRTRIALLRARRVPRLVLYFVGGIIIAYPIALFVGLWLLLRSIFSSQVYAYYVRVNSYMCVILFIFFFFLFSMCTCMFVKDEIRDTEKDGRSLIRCAPSVILFLCFL